MIIQKEGICKQCNERPRTLRNLIGIGNLNPIGESVVKQREKSVIGI